MGDERYSRTSKAGDYGRNFGSGRDYSYSSAREYQAADRLGDDAHRDWGSREYGNDRYEQRDRSFGGGRDQYRGGYDQGANRDRGYGRPTGYGANMDRSGNSQYHGSYAHDGRRFEDVGRYRDQDDDSRRGRDYGSRDRGYGRQPQGYDYEERGFFARAGDEVRSWFGDEEAERRRQFDEAQDERQYGRDEHSSDRHYQTWRRGQIDALDRDYHEYRNENRDRFNSEFATWRTARQGQRDSLGKVEEHMDVVGSDGEHVGTVDKVRGDRIVLTKSDADAGGHHHSIPSRWIQTVDTKVTLSKTAQEAKNHWRDEERQQPFGSDSNDRTRSDQTTGDRPTAGTNLNKSFSGTY
ncbi:hypothetical protein SAMN05192583_2162 [Sphingomonas gellani]|uniref:DUF2171 domain-containing protein n=1 Tax=Sphingomonas gellani TaxID=1166340 RepID=A0A1H8EG14_9SPHN|nr:DUF2171 domain-containing protein [Sphingomonas gellani]SEN18330.1 hypothetical protein SAMN05192583_2162 [Sphingomonas gellani]